VTGPSDANLGPVTQHAQGAGLKQMNSMCSHAVTLKIPIREQIWIWYCLPGGFVVPKGAILQTDAF